jgi:peptidoglycan/LPS O-acetylase OafA/YrhL
MSTILAPSNIASTRPATSLRRATVTVGVVAAAVTTGLVAALHAAGVPFAAEGEVPLAAFAQFTFIGAVLGGLLVTVLNRRSAVPRQRFVQTTAALVALSCVAPIVYGDGVTSTLALIGTHLVAAAMIVPVLERHTTD